MSQNKLFGGVALSALSLLAPAALAQETTSSVRGAVVSVDGSPVDVATITVTHLPSGTTSSEDTSAGGEFDLRGLRPGGPYLIEVTGAFAGQAVDGVFLEVGNPLRLTFQVEPATDIVVTAKRPNTSGTLAGSTTSLDRDAIAGVVSINRDIRDLARRSPLVTQNTRGDGGLSIAGSNPRQNRITIDGVQAQDSFGLNTGGLPTRRGPISIDAVEQLSVQPVPFDVINGDFNGGAIDIVLKQGTNEFDGSAFVNYLNDGLVGTRIDGRDVNLDETQENWGVSLFGPLWKDRLFFGMTYETYESADATSFPAFIWGPTATSSTGAGAVVITQAQIDAVTGVLANTYGQDYPVGALSPTKPITDEKYTARLDWNIIDGHRASLTYRNAESIVFNRTNLGSTTAALDSQWYFTGEDDNTYALQFNSDWTDRLSTELRLSTRDYTRLQEPPAGQFYSDVSVCSTPTITEAASGTQNPTTTCRNGTFGVASVRWGADQFRHANYLTQADQNVHFAASYELGAHFLKAGVQWANTEIFNLFLPNSDGTYYFDSIADFSAGRANRLVYRNALTNNPNDAAAEFTYALTTLFVQDRWDVNDQLTLTGGLRYDTYSSDDKPVLNPNFVSRYGYSNQDTYDGLDILMPRVSFTYDPSENLRISGGFGLFSGGLPDVFISNSFSNTGFIDNTLQFERRTGTVPTNGFSVGGGFHLIETTGGVNCATASQTCLDALNVPVNANTFVAGNIPASVQAALGGTTVSPTSETNSIAPDFAMPSDWRANVAFDYDAPLGIRLGFDGVFFRTKDGLAFRDLRVQPLLDANGVQRLTPDGRLRYTTTPGSSRDIQAYNPDEENWGYTAAFSAGRDFGAFSVDGTYIYQDIEEYSASARFSSTANSLYGGQYASIDPNTAVSGRGQEEIEHAFKLDVQWRKEFFKDLETRVSLFGDYRSGRPLSFTMNAGSGRNSVFGVNRGSQLAYIPNFAGWDGASLTLPNDSRVRFADIAAAQGVFNLVQSFSLEQGSIAERGASENPDILRFDLQLSQDLPAFTPWMSDDKFKLTLDFFNIGNLLNDEWGTVSEFGESINLYNVACNDTTTCTQYVLSSPGTANLNPNNEQSRWAIQVGLRYEF